MDTFLCFHYEIRYNIPLVDNTVTNLFDIFPFSGRACESQTDDVKQ